MRIVYLCQYFAPEIGAPSARLYEMSKAWVESGHGVTVVTGFPNHPTGVVPPEYRGRLWATETMDGIRVLRNWLYATPNEGFFKKTLGHLSFMLSAVLLGLPRLGPIDVVVVSSPTFFSVFSAYATSRIKHVPFIFEVRDLWPAIFVDLGVIRNRIAIRLLESVEMFLYRRARRVVTVTDSFRETLIRRGLPPDKVVTITNGADVEFFRPLAAKDEGGRRKVEGSTLQPSSLILQPFTVLYLGAHGISHGLTFVLHAAARLRQHDDIQFLFVGEGAEKKGLMALKDEIGLANVQFLAGQPKDRVLSLYHSADAGLVPLRDVRAFEAFIPSKMFELMACGVPIIGAVRGEAARILERSGAARLVPPEDPDALAGAILALRADPDLRRRMGEAGREFVEANYDRRKLAERYAEVLSEVVRERQSRTR